MVIISRFAAFCRNLFRKRSVERQLDDELRSFVDLLTEEKMRNGLAQDAARRRALLEVQGIEQVKEAARDARTGAGIELLLRDLRFGLRVLGSKPGFFISASLTLALGIGIATTVYSMVESQLWRPLPFPNSERLVVISAHNLKQTWMRTNVSAPDFLDFRERTHAFESMAALDWMGQQNVRAAGLTERSRVAAVSSDFFRTLGVQLAAGRAFRREDERTSGLREVILAGRLARRAFGTLACTGRTIKLNGDTYTVVGVLPENFRFEIMQTQAVFLPLELRSDGKREDRSLLTIARLKSGIGMQQARADLASVAQSTALEHPDTNANWGAEVENLRANFTGYFRSRLLLYLAFAVFVLALACANVAGLQLVRSVARQSEFAIREALGASRMALTRQAFSEGIWIAVAGAVVGVLLANWGVTALQSIAGSNIWPRETVFSLDLSSIWFAVCVTALSTLIFGLTPSFATRDMHVESALRDSSRSSAGSIRTRRRIDLIAAAEVMLAFIAVFGAGLFVGSYRELERVRLGFDPKNVLTIRIPLGSARYSDEKEARAFYERVKQQAESGAGVQDFALANSLPLSGAGNVNVTTASAISADPGLRPSVLARVVSPRYFALLDIPLLEGRAFTDHDSQFAPRVAIVNENFARRFFPGQNAIGNEVILSGGDVLSPDETESERAVSVRIVGVAPNTKEVDLNEVNFEDIYLPFAQNPSRDMYAMVKTNAPESMGPLLRRKFSYLDKDEFVADPRSLDSYVEDALKARRSVAAPVVTFSGLALLLAAIALYGAISFAVAERTREFGLRMALGARRTGVVALTLRRVIRLSLAGSICGLVIAFVLGAIFRTAFFLVPHEHSGMLYGVSIHDPLSFAVTGALVILFAICAGLLPAIRATRIDPWEALRYQ